MDAAGRQARRAEYEAHGLLTDERLGWLVHDIAERMPDAEFIVIGDDRFSYGQIATWASAFGRALVRAGVARGDRVLIQLPNQVEALVAQVACFRIGAVNVPVVPIYREHEMAHIIGNCRPSAIVSVRAIKDRRLTEEIDGILAGLAMSPTRFCVDDQPPEGWQAFPGLPTTIDLDPTLPDPLPADECAVILYTSGTTSAPKGARIAGSAFISNARAVRMVVGLSRSDVFFVCSPLSHLAGFVAGIVWPSSLGAKVVVMPKWEPDEAAAVIERERATFTTAAAVFLHDLIGVYRTGRHPDHRLTYFMSGGATTPPAMIREAHGLGVFAFRGYGMTETGGGVCWAGPFETPDVCAETDGRVIHGTVVQAVDPDRRPLPAGEEGELRVLSPQNMIGYTDEAQTRAQVDDEGWLYTGDVGRVTADGLVTITGRVKDIINRGGEKFSARQIEEAILAHPSVSTVAVVGLPDPRLGETVGAFVTLAEGAQWRGGGDVADSMKASGIALQKIPTQWFVVDQLPRTATGKVQKHVLLARAAEAADPPPTP